MRACVVRYAGADSTQCGADQVWCYPSHSPEDMCVLDAVEPPADYAGSAKLLISHCTMLLVKGKRCQQAPSRLTPSSSAVMGS